MSYLTRYEPFSIEPVSDFLHKLFRTQRGLTVSEDGTLADMKLDIAENDTAYVVKAELPGVEKENIDVKIEGNSVSICAKAAHDKETKEGERIICRERYTGAVSRLFSLPHELDTNTANAQFKDGLLTLTLPKKASMAQKRVQIH